ncbi:hypothetical protein BH695_3473 [Microcystis aeruginosa PCC 7806SL]|uniref:Uncharacterized protein n=1 Tax=Microcystis aeruginosa PCC 7806SL TaxID=1903187 RepID=A0AB33BS68_MICA7|nr:hypothetical protein BH695_3473 [Microcystis aeruginosa PCC 7806SL]
MATSKLVKPHTPHPTPHTPHPTPRKNFFSKPYLSGTNYLNYKNLALLVSVWKRGLY